MKARHDISNNADLVAFDMKNRKADTEQCGKKMV
jgi:hypothetical protein